jgi:hypothetical protein
LANHTLLDAINEVFKRTNNIQGDAAALTTLTDSARQHPIDMAIQVINEGIDELYSSSAVEKPLGQAESTITLATGTRSYALASNLERLKFPLIDKTNTQFIISAPGGYEYLLLIDPEQDDTGLPIWAAISPVTGQLYLDRAPTSAENARVYTYQYEKDVSLVLATDTVPFSNVVFRSMVPAWTQLYKREMRNEFDAELYKMAIGRAAIFLTELEPRDSYNPRVKTAESWL